MSVEQSTLFSANDLTPYPGVNRILEELFRKVSSILGKQMVGMYLYGSLAYGGFEVGSSDIDFLFATKGVINEPDFKALERVHASIAESGLEYAHELEGSYIPVSALRRYDPTDCNHPSIGLDWPFGIVTHGPEWILERSIIRRSGIAIVGPPPETLIDPVSPDELRGAVQDLLREFWSQQLDGPDWLRRRNYQAFAVLSMCRALYTLDTGELASKPFAATWALEKLDASWRPLIERSLAWRFDTEIDDLSDTMAFVRFVVEQHGSDDGKASAPVQ